MFEYTKVVLFVSCFLIGQLAAQTDCGTCGNACCTLQFQVDQKSDDLTGMMRDNLMKGGPDGAFRLIKVLNLTDEERPSGVRNIMQIRHIGTTTNTSIQFVIASNYSLTSTLRGFSISNLPKDLCDSGDNFMLMMNFIKNLSLALLRPPGPLSRLFTELSPRGGYTERFKRHVAALCHKRRLRTAKYHLYPRNWEGPGHRIRDRPGYRPDHRPPARPPLLTDPSL